MSDSFAAADSSVLLGSVVIRPVAESDAGALSAAYVRNRDFLQPWEPVRPESFYTPAGQQALAARAVAEQAAGRSIYWVLFEGTEVVGRISLTDIVRGAFQNGHLGYWMAEHWQGRGLATAAARFACSAGAALGLHRIQAGTLVHNIASQTVLGHNGFIRIGLAENYIRINGFWQDHVLFQKILSD
ncbi:MAG: GNAT family N-acetyltransferase [Specibacter sp.]